MTRLATAAALLLIPVPLSADQVIFEEVIQIEQIIQAGGGQIQVRTNKSGKKSNNNTKPQAPAKELSLAELKFPALDKALEQSAKDGRHIIVTTRADWDDWSKQMAEKIFGNPKYDDTMSRKYITVVIDVTRDDEDSNRVIDGLAIKAVPETIIFNDKGEQIRRIGFIDGGLDRFIRAVGEDGADTDAERVSNFNRNSYYNQRINVTTPLRKPEKPVDMAKLQEITKQQQQGVWGGLQVNVVQKEEVKKKAVEEKVKIIQKDVEVEKKKKIEKAVKPDVKPKAKVEQEVDPAEQARIAQELAKALQKAQQQGNQKQPDPEEVAKLFEKVLREAQEKDEDEKKAKPKAIKPKIKLVKPRGVEEKKAKEKDNADK